MALKPSQLALGAAAAAGVAIGVVAVNFTGEALADRADTVVSSSADWESVTLRKYTNNLPDGGVGTPLIDVTVCGTALLQSGEVSPADRRCDSVDLGAGQQTTINNFVANALAKWKSKRGL